MHIIYWSPENGRIVWFFFIPSPVDVALPAYFMIKGEGGCMMMDLIQRLSTCKLLQHVAPLFYCCFFTFSMAQ